MLVYGVPALDASSRLNGPDPSRITEVIVVRPDPLLGLYGRVTPLVQAWVDLFCLYLDGRPPDSSIICLT